MAAAWEQRKLCDIADFGKGQGYTKSDLKESGTPIILYGRLYTKYEPIIREVDTFADVILNAVFSKGGEVILPSSGETAEDIAIAASVDKSGFLLGGGLNVVFPHRRINSAFLALQISFGTPHDEALTPAEISRFTTKAGIPSTWGEAITLRVKKQASYWRKTHPYGAYHMNKDKIK